MGEDTLSQLIRQARQLPPEERLRLIALVTDTLSSSTGRRRLVYGRFRGERMSGEEDFQLAEWYPDKA